MAPTPLDEALEGETEGSSARYGLRIAFGLRIAAGLGTRPDCRIKDYSMTWTKFVSGQGANS
eukprot:6266078-Alexandrium_andersonii.AAC.1